MRSSKFIIAILILLVTGVSISQPSEPIKNVDIRDELKELKRESAAIKDSLDAVRRDQINYKIEKDRCILNGIPRNDC